MPVSPYENAPEFFRGDVAKILGCTTLTIRNQEARKTFPEARRAANGYRLYSLVDVIRLQMLYNKHINLNAILSALWDKKYRDIEQCQYWLQIALQTYNTQPIYNPPSLTPEEEVALNAKSEKEEALLNAKG